MLQMLRLLFSQQLTRVIEHTELSIPTSLGRVPLPDGEPWYIYSSALLHQLIRNAVRPSLSLTCLNRLIRPEYQITQKPACQPVFQPFHRARPTMVKVANIHTNSYGNIRYFKWNGRANETADFGAGLPQYNVYYGPLQHRETISNVPCGKWEDLNISMHRWKDRI